METSSDKPWEVPSRLLEYVRKYITHHVPERDIKEKTLSENPISNNIKRTPSIDKYIKELLLENKKTLTLNDEDAFKNILITK